LRASRSKAPLRNGVTRAGIEPLNILTLLFYVWQAEGLG
jgi:hypothetical protein